MKMELPRILKEIKSNPTLKAMFAGICFFLDDEIRYDVTPINAIPFAKTGSNGCHFCFLPDKKNQNGLEMSLIILVNLTAKRSIETPKPI